MRKRILFLTSLLLLVNTMVFAASNIMFDKANQLYHNKNYAEAANLYQQMIDDGFCEADLFYNAGNAYYRINKIGLSIWNFEKALQLKQTKNYTDNLILAQKRIKESIATVKDIFFIRWWKSFTNLFSLNGWALVALGSFLIGMIILFLKKFNTRFESIKWLVNVLFPITFISLGMMFYQWNRTTNHFQAIIIEATESYNNKVKISEGLKVQFVKKGKLGTWVKLPNEQVVEIKKSVLKRL